MATLKAFAVLGEDRTRASPPLPRGAWLVTPVLALTWLTPWVWGPSPAAVQLLVTLVLVGITLMLWPPHRPAASLVPLALALCGLTVAGFSFSHHSASAHAGLTAGLICLAAGACLGMVSADHRRAWALVACVWIVAAAANAVAGWLQFAGWTEAFTGWISESAQGQIFGNLRQRNQFATLMNIGLIASFFVAAALPPRRVWLTGSCVVLLASANALSGSRIGAIGLVLSCVVCCIWCWCGAAWARGQVRGAAVVYATLTIFMFLRGATSGARGLLARGTETSLDCNSRLTLWSNVLDLIGQRPWRGWGWGELDYAHFAADYDGVRFCAILDNAHNLPLHLAVELGVPMALTLLAGTVFVVKRAQPWHETQPGRRLAWMVLALVMLHSLVEYPLWYGPFQLTVGLAVGMLIARPAESAAPQATWPVHVQRALGALMVAAAAYAAWDYWRVSQIYKPQNARATSYRDNTLEKISSSWLFADQVRFARLTTTPLTSGNAAQMHELAERMLHFSPEPAVIEKYIDSAKLLGREADAAWAEQRYAAAFPAEHARWKALSAAR